MASGLVADAGVWQESCAWISASDTFTDACGCSTGRAIGGGAYSAGHGDFDEYPTFPYGYTTFTQPNYTPAFTLPPIYEPVLAVLGSRLTTANAPGPAFEASWSEVPDEHWVSGEHTAIDVHAICNDAHCVQKQQNAWTPDTVPSKTVTVTCPAGWFAVSGGYTVTGTPIDVEVHASGPTGVWLPMGWTASARTPQALSDWGLQVDVACVPPSVLAEVTSTSGFVSVESGEVTESGGLGESYAAFSEAVSTQPSHSHRWVLAVGGRTVGGGGLTSVGDSDGIRVAAVLHADEPAWEGQLAKLTTDEIGLYALHDSGFEAALDLCDPTPWSPPVDTYLEIGGDVWFGLLAGGGGVIFLPGQGPVPVDPAPFRAAFDALPAAVVQYASWDDMEERLNGVLDGLDRSGESWEMLEDVADTVDLDLGPGVAFVIPQDEEAAVEWLSENRDELVGLPHMTALLLVQDGPGMQALDLWDENRPVSLLGGPRGAGGATEGCGCQTTARPEAVFALYAVLLFGLRRRR